MANDAHEVVRRIDAVINADLNHQAKRHRLEQEVIEAAKEWAITPDDYISQRQSDKHEEAKTKLQNVIDALITFESSGTKPA